LPFALTDKILDAYYPPEEFRVIVIYAPLGLGKSSYQFKVSVEVLQQVYDLSEEEAWEVLKGFIVFHPDQFFAKIGEIEANYGRVPLLNWDDAGLWLFAMDWNDPFIEAFLKWLNVARTRLASLLLSTPSPVWVLKKLREFPQAVTIRIQKLNGHRSGKYVWIREARGYISWIAPDLKKSGVRPSLIDVYDCRMPDNFYQWYKPLRDTYEQMARQLIMEKWEQIREKSKSLALNQYPELQLPNINIKKKENNHANP